MKAVFYLALLTLVGKYFTYTFLLSSFFMNFSGLNYFLLFSVNGKSDFYHSFLTCKK